MTGYALGALKCMIWSHGLCDSRLVSNWQPGYVIIIRPRKPFARNPTAPAPVCLSPSHQCFSNGPSIIDPTPRSTHRRGKSLPTEEHTNRTGKNALTSGVWIHLPLPPIYTDRRKQKNKPNQAKPASHDLASLGTSPHAFFKLAQYACGSAVSASASVGTRSLHRAAKLCMTLASNSSVSGIVPGLSSTG